MPQEWKESIILPIYKKGEKRYWSCYRGIHFCQLLTKFYPTFCSICRENYCGSSMWISKQKSTTAFVKYLRKNWNTMK